MSTMEKEVKQSKKIRLAKGTMNDLNVGHSITLNISTSVRLCGMLSSSSSLVEILKQNKRLSKQEGVKEYMCKYNHPQSK